MECKKCKRPIPRFAEHCPYCNKLTEYGLQRKGERFIEKLSPANIIKSLKHK